MATVPARAPIASPRQRERLYIIGGIVATLVVLVGFSRTYFLKELFGTPTLTPLVHLHGIVFSSWIVVFVTQATLVSARRTQLHMKLGILGFLLAITMVVVGTLTAITAAKLGHSPGPPPLRFLVVPMTDMVVFPILIAAGFCFRRRPDFHKRIMIIATLGILTAAFGRMMPWLIGARNPLAAMAATSLLIITAITYDSIRHRRLHPAFACAGALVMLSFPGRILFGQTEAWMSIARWLTS